MSIRTVLACALILLLGACSTVKSTRTTQNDSHPPGLTYFLPMRLMKLTVSPAVPDLKKLLASRDELVAALAQAEAGQTVSAAVLERAEALLLKATSDDAKAKLTTARDLAASEAAMMEDIQVQADGALAIVNAKIAAASKGSCDFDAKLELLPAQADTSQRYVATLAHNVMRDDDMTLKVSPQGLLTNAKAIATDRTSDIVAEFAGALASVGGGSINSRAEPGPAIDCKQKMVMVFDPVKWRGGQPPAYVDGVAATPHVFPGIEEVNIALFPFGLSLDNGALPRQPSNPTKPRWGSIYYRAAMPVVITVKKKGTPVEAAVVNLPQAGPISYIPMRSSAFVKTVDEVEFVDGSVASWNTNRPSEVLEVVRLPVKVLTSIISVPASLISLRVDHSSKANALAENQAKEMQSAEHLRQVKLCVDAAAAAGTPATACF